MSRKRKSPARGPVPQGVIPRESQARPDSITDRASCQERRRRRTDQKDLNIEPGYWAVIPSEVRYDPTLTMGARLLYAEISSLTGKTGYCFASNAYFQKLYGVSEPTVQRYLRALKARGYIAILDGEGGAGRRRIYAGINPLLNNPLKNDGVPENPLKNDGVTPSKMTPPTSLSRNNNNPPKAPQGEKRARRKRKEKAACEWEPELFERFWNLYPRGEGKAAARYAWDDLKPDRKLMKEMSAALKRQMKTEEWLRGVGVPWAVRWLNERRWEWEVGVALAAEESPDAAEDEEDLPEWT